MRWTPRGTAPVPEAQVTYTALDLFDRLHSSGSSDCSGASEPRQVRARRASSRLPPIREIFTIIGTRAVKGSGTAINPILAKRWADESIQDFQQHLRRRCGNL